VKKVLSGIVMLLGVLALGAGGFVLYEVHAFDQSMEKRWDLPPLDLARSTDPAVIARGNHLVHGVAACSGKDCHGHDLAGGNTLLLGPGGEITAPNITGAGITATYSDGELARLIRYGIKRTGTSVTFMPCTDFNWLPDDDLRAVVSYLRTVPNVDKASGPLRLGVLGKILDRRGMFPMDIARKVDGKVELAGKPEPTAAYGRFLARACMTCHGAGLSGGPIPGAPKDLPVPRNLTPDETGLKGWTLADFDNLLVNGIRKNGKKLHPFMPIENTRNMDDVEKQALFAYLMSLPPKPFGGR